MSQPESLLAFGPVPSRRLGQSLGINNIPPKTCSYACVYCQLGRTTKMRVERQPFYPPLTLFQAVQDKMHQAQERGQAIDYATFVPDGEPTLDINLGHEIALLKPLGIPLAVISNASLIWQQDTRHDLSEADWVSLKADAVREDIWRRIDRPHGTLRLQTIMAGALAFAREFRGTLTTETMLVAGINDDEAHLEELGCFLASLNPHTAYLSIPTRPPAEAWVSPPSEKALNRAYQILCDHVRQVEYLIGYEGNAFASTGDMEADLLSITAVHPMRKDAVDDLITRAGSTWQIVHELVAQDKLVEAHYQGHRYYLRKLGALARR